MFMDTIISTPRKRSKARTSSAMTDEALAKALQEEKMLHPEEFAKSGMSVPEINGKSILCLSSGRAIEPMKKWL